MSKREYCSAGSVHWSLVLEFRKKGATYDVQRQLIYTTPCAARRAGSSVGKPPVAGGLPAGQRRAFVLHVWKLRAAGGMGQNLARLVFQPPYPSYPKDVRRMFEMRKPQGVILSGLSTGVILFPNIFGTNTLIILSLFRVIGIIRLSLYLSYYHINNFISYLSYYHRFCISGNISDPPHVNPLHPPPSQHSSWIDSAAQRSAAEWIYAMHVAT